MKNKRDKFGRFDKSNIDLLNKKFNLLTPLQRLRKRNRWYWECQCDCGEITVIREYLIYSGKTKSCGCAYKNSFSPGEVNNNVHYINYKRSAKSRNLEFNLSKLDFIKMTQQNCFYCNAIPIEKKFVKTANGPAIINGIDRINNNKGYLLDNCVPCCTKCNLAKHILSTKDFFDLVKSIYLHHNLGNK